MSDKGVASDDPAFGDETIPAAAGAGAESKMAPDGTGGEKREVLGVLAPLESTSKRRLKVIPRPATPVGPRMESHDAECAAALVEARNEVEKGTRTGGLVELDLDNRYINDEAAHDLGEIVKGCSTIVALSLHKNGLTASGVRSLMDGLSLNGHHLRKLDLNNNHIGCDGAGHVHDYLTKNTGLKELDLSHCRVSDDGAGLIAVSLLSNHTLEALDLSFGYPNSITALGARPIADALANNTVLTSLNLESNEIFDEGVEGICKALRDHESESALRTLVLNNNGLSVRSALVLGALLECTSHLETLAVGSNELTDEGVSAIISGASKCPSLTSLDLHMTDLEPAGAEEVALMLSRNDRLRKMSLAGNLIGDEGGMVIADALMTNTTLTSLDLSDVGMFQGGAARLAYSLRQKNRTLTELDLSLNEISTQLLAEIEKQVARNGKGAGSSACIIL